MHRSLLQIDSLFNCSLKHQPFDSGMPIERKLIMQRSKVAEYEIFFKTVLIPLLLFFLVDIGRLTQCITKTWSLLKQLSRQERLRYSNSIIIHNVVIKMVMTKNPANHIFIMVICTFWLSKPALKKALPNSSLTNSATVSPKLSLT